MPAPSPSPGPLPMLAAWRRGLVSRGAATIRRKLILLHTLFSLVMAAVLMLALRPAISDLLVQEELRECRLGLEALAASFSRDESSMEDGVPPVQRNMPPGVDLARGAVALAALSSDLADAARAAPGENVSGMLPSGRAVVARFDPRSGEFMSASVSSPEARAAIDRIYLLLAVSLLGVYAVIALALEVFVLPRQVYGPIARLRSADEAVATGRREHELIPDTDIPADELGDIMRSRNATVAALRRQEQALGDALRRIEETAGELKRKNHLLETARRNLADQDRLASLGMMSAGIAHELNTPLAVLKGCVEDVAGAGGNGRGPSAPDPDRAALMLRVVQRLERLSESLLDFARVRPPKLDRVDLAAVVREAWTLVSLDRGGRSADLDAELPPGTVVVGDADRLTQVLVNLLRNSLDAMDRLPKGALRSVRVTTERSERDSTAWISLTISDTGPGIEPSLFPRLFEPFVSTRLDSTGTGLGLAVAEGIVREHGGVLLARNTSQGAQFEVMLPEHGPVPVLRD